MNWELYHTTDIGDKNFLITGGAGFIGSHIVDYLLHFGAGKVRVLDNFTTGSAKNIEEYEHHPAFELIEGDIRDVECCQKSCAGINYVSHQAALGSVPRSINDPITTNAVNIDGFLNMLTAARDNNVKRFVYAASSSTYGDHPALPKKEENIGRPLSPYAITKFVNELYADIYSSLYGYHSIGLRYFNVFGPRQNPEGPYAAVIPIFIQSALNKGCPFINGDGETSRDFTYVANAVQANIKSLLQEQLDKHEVVNIAFGQQTTLNELWKKITSLANTNSKPLYREERKGDVKHSLASIEKAQKLINYLPGITVQQGLEQTYEWYKKNALIQ